jgi:hypothetical protein
VILSACVGSELSSGDLPYTTKTQSKFEADMRQAKDSAGLAVQTMTLWYLFCLATGDMALCKGQWMHCQADLKKDFPASDAASWVPTTGQGMMQLISSFQGNDPNDATLSVFKNVQPFAMESLSPFAYL